MPVGRRAKQRICFLCLKPHHLGMLHPSGKLCLFICFAFWICMLLFVATSHPMAGHNTHNTIKLLKQRVDLSVYSSVYIHTHTPNPNACASFEKEVVCCFTVLTPFEGFYWLQGLCQKFSQDGGCRYRLARTFCQYHYFSISST